MAKGFETGNIVKLENVSKTYFLDGISVEAVKNVSLIIKEGEFVSIVGPSGSGKSTLMNLIGLLDKPTAGRIIISGIDTSDLSERELATIRNRKIGFVFQTFNLLPRTSALSNVMLPLQYNLELDKSKRKDLAFELLKKMGLEKKINNLPSQLSGGEQQRVAIARALVCNPDIVLADEPTGNLDSKSGEQVLEVLTKLNQEGRTIMVVTHDLKIAGYAKRAIKIVDGQIVSDRKTK